MKSRAMTMMMSNLEVNINHDTNFLWKPTTHTICVQEAGEVSDPFCEWIYESMLFSAKIMLDQWKYTYGLFKNNTLLIEPQTISVTLSGDPM
jgi:hypothetical protein